MLTCYIVHSKSEHDYKDEQQWFNFRTTWGPDFSQPEYFATQPRTIEEAKAAGWRQVDSHCMKDGP